MLPTQMCLVVLSILLSKSQSVLPNTITGVIYKSITRQDWNLCNVVIIDWDVWLELVQSIYVIC